MTANYTKKRPRERPTADSELFAIYEDLASENDGVRLRAASRLTCRFDAATDPATLEPVLKRLIKGVCSSRKGARLGFSIALTEFLSHHAGRREVFTPDYILGLAEQLTQPPGDASGQEARDYYIGRLFVAEAIIISGILLFPDDDDAQKWKKMLDVVLPLAQKKPWLREQCAWVLYRGMNTIASIEFDKNRGPATLQSFVDNGLIKSPEGVAIWLFVRKMNPTCSLPKNVFEKDDPLAPQNRKLLVRIMKEDSSKADNETAEMLAQRGSWSSAPNFAWDVIISSILESAYAADFAQYWRELVDEGIFAATSSKERKLSGFTLFASRFESLQVGHLPALISRNIVVNMNQQLSTKKGYLHQAANQALQAMLSRAQASPEIIQPILQRLLADDAVMKLALSPNLRLKLTEKLVSCATVEQVQSVIGAMLTPMKAGTPFASNRTPTLDNLLVLVITRIRSLPYPSTSEQGLTSVRKLYRNLLKSLAQSAYFVKGAETQASNDTEHSLAEDNEFYRNQLNNALANLLIKDPDPSYYYIQVAKALGELDEDHSGAVLLNEQVRAQVEKARKRASKLAKDKDEAPPHHKALALLFSLCIIQIYSGDADALEALDDLQECYKGITDSENADEQAKAADAIVEIVLSFTSKPATMCKILAHKAFALCTDIVTRDGLQSMLEVLSSKEDISGQTEMFDQRDDEASDEDIDGAEDSDVEMVDAGDGAGSNEGDETALKESDDDSNDSDSSNDNNGDETEKEDEDEDEGEDLEDSDDEELMAFDAKLAEALGTRRADADMAHDEDESSESDMDDDQMEALDGHITTMFKQMKQAENKTKKKEQKEAKETMVIFKTRVLELIKTYIKEQHAHPLAIQLILPLVELVKDTHNAKVRSEAIELLHNFFKRVKLVKKDGAADKKTRKEAKQLLSQVHELVAAKRSKPLQTACSHASLLLTKVFLSNGGDVKDITKQYEKTAERVANKPARFRNDFFKSWELWYLSAKNDLEK